MPTVLTDDGVSIHYYVDDFTDPWLDDRDKETVVLYPALWEPATFLAPMVPTLARRYRTVRIDMRGRGLSGAPPAPQTLSGGPDESSLGERQARDTMCVLDALGVEAVHWFGQGGGGLTGLASAVLWPRRVKTLVMSGSPLRLPESFRQACALGEPSMTAAVEKYGVAEFNRRGVWRHIIDHSRLDERMARWIAAQRDRVPLDIMVRTTRFMEAFDFTEWLPRVSCPTLLINAEKEAAVTPDQRQAMARAIPNVQVREWAGVGRGIHLFEAEAVARAVLEFIEQSHPRARRLPA